MNIIFGKYSNKKLLYDSSKSITRPTKQVVKKSIFSTIGFKSFEDKIVLDIFAGSGQLGFESYSLGATKIYLNDKNNKARNYIKQNIQKMKDKEYFSILSFDAFDLVEKLSIYKPTIVFVNPNYHFGRICLLIHKIMKYKFIKKEGIISIETDKRNYDKINIVFRLKINKYKFKKIKTKLKNGVYIIIIWL